jgi:hypothetical protein
MRIIFRAGLRQELWQWEWVCQQTYYERCFRKINKWKDLEKTLRFFKALDLVKSCKNLILHLIWLSLRLVSSDGHDLRTYFLCYKQFIISTGAVISSCLKDSLEKEFKLDRVMDYSNLVIAFQVSYAIGLLGVVAPSLIIWG